LKEQLSQLIELQKVESEINRINIKCRDLPREIARLEESYRIFLSDLEEHRRKFEEVKKEHREKEEKLKAGQDMLKRTKGRLGEVKTNKEYQSVLKEIATAESKNSELEEQIILLLEAVDTAKETVKTQEKGMASGVKDYEDTKKKLEVELQSLDGKLSTCRQKSELVKKKISADSLNKYFAIKKLHNALPVAAVWKEVCEGCHMNIPPQLYIELQKAVDLHTCPNCNRIIYWCDQSETKG